VIGDPTLEIWKEAPRKIKVTVNLRPNGVEISLSECPNGCVISLWAGDTMLKRIEPSSTRFSVSLRGAVIHLPGRPPAELTEKGIVVCCWAPGYKYLEEKVKTTTDFMRRR
jgi:hypothetical protein